MIAVGEKADLSASAIQDLRVLPRGRDPETHVYVVWMNYSDQFLSLEWYLRKIAGSTVNSSCKNVALHILQSGGSGRWA